MYFSQYLTTIQSFLVHGNCENYRKYLSKHFWRISIEKIGAQRVRAPFARPHQIICIELNYADHAEDSGSEVPLEPIFLTKAANTIVGIKAEVIIAKVSKKCD